jgi:8-oxo-dGTP diphosphatase
LLHADIHEVRRAARDVPGRLTAALAQLPAGTLLTLELRRAWWDRRPRRLALRALHNTISLIELQTNRVTIVAAALMRDGRVLAAQRNHPPEMAGKWEFPGGKVEHGETPQAALIRECAEELGTQIVVGPELARQDLETGALLILFAARLAAASTDPVALEHRELGWFGSEQLIGLDWLTTNERFVTEVTGRL